MISHTANYQSPEKDASQNLAESLSLSPILTNHDLSDRQPSRSQRQDEASCSPPRETILAALHALLRTLPATALRGAILPERVPSTGILILRDGEPGAPQVTLSPLRYHYQHRAELEAAVEGVDRDKAFAALCDSIGAAIVAERTLGILCDWVEAEAPRPIDLPVEGAARHSLPRPGERRGVGCDCLWLVRGVWRKVVGEEPLPVPPYSRDWGEIGGVEVLAEAAAQVMLPADPAGLEPGMLLLFRMRRGAVAKHCGILTEVSQCKRRFIHASERLGMIEEPLTWAWRRRIA